MSKLLKLISLFAILLNTVYAVWLVTHITNWLGWFLVVAEFVFAGSFNLFVFNHWTQSHVKRSFKRAEGTLDVFLPVVNEPLDIFEATLKAASNIYYTDKTVYVLDDGARSEVRQLADEYGAVYLSSPDNREYKAGNMNYGLARSNGEFILALDADQVADPHIATQLLGHFQDNPKLAIVTTRQSYEVSRGDFNNDHVFYAHMQPGKNKDNAAISTGTGVIYRRNAVEAIGGFQTWNIVEDLYTSYVLHTSGYKSLYVDKAYTHGTAPFDLPMIYKQRGTCAADTMRIWFKKNPLITKGLSWRQRLHYVEMCLSYAVPAFALPFTFGLLPLTELLNVRMIRDVPVYMLLRLPSIALLMVVMYLMADKSTHTLRFWAGLFPVFFKGVLLATRRQKMRYIVTTKTMQLERATRLVIPQMVLVGVNAVALAVHLSVHHALPDMLDVFWFAMVLYWFYPVIARAFLWEPQLRVHAPPRKGLFGRQWRLPRLSGAFQS